MKNGHKHEKIVKTFDYHGARVDLVEWDDTLPIVEYYKHNSDTYDIEACYLYVPVQEL